MAKQPEPTVGEQLAESWGTEQDSEETEPQEFATPAKPPPEETPTPGRKTNQCVWGSAIVKENTE